MTAKSRKKGRVTRRQDFDRRQHQPIIETKRSSILGWIVLLCPASVILFFMLFGGMIPFLAKQAAVESEDAAEIVCQGAAEDMKVGNYPGAYSKLMYALQVKPDYVDAYIKLGHLSYLNNDIPAAIAWLKKAVALDPPQKNLVLNNLGLLYARQKDYQTALRMFEQALSTGLNAEQIYGNIGNAHLSLGNYAEAVEAFEAALNSRTTLHLLYLEMLRKALIDFSTNAEFSDLVKTVQDHLRRGVNSQDLQPYDGEIVIRFSRTPEREAELRKNLTHALRLRGEIPRD